MKKQTWMVLFVSVALGVSALAQNSASSSTSQMPSGVQSTSEREPLEQPRAQNFWDGDDPNLFNLVAHPWANKKYVLRHTLPIKDRLNELDEITAENSVKIKDIDSRSQQALKQASEKVSLADQHATEALDKSQLAQTAANNASTRVASAERVAGNHAEYKGSAQTEIRFRPGQSVLSKNAKRALDDMAAPLKDKKSYIIEVRGFAPGRGHTAVVNSKKMADSVVRYLVLKHQIPVHRIYVMSLGNAGLTASASQRATRGRVEVSVMQSGLVETAQR
ncbi:MAG TPA: OmpA family protein [Candidatus Acidoferrum sp.]|jgi:outer membrane protein OmpA-like peptidoglycan-associated protein|nr:OmpA family protein [Candidatus Acidoferrum sp.]